MKTDFILLKYGMLKNDSVKATVCGISMFPILIESDIVDIKNYTEYQAGDILVYQYKEQGVLIHRLLKIVGNNYYCKGDNAFLLEEVEKKNIIGKVIGVTRNNLDLALPKVDDAFIKLSYKVSKEFRILGYDKKKIAKNEIYQKFLNHRNTYAEVK